jgi:lipopolysaccharide biosynthesis glycosyltransferase
MIRTFIGYDDREAVAFSVLSHSIHKHASEPVAVTPVRLSQLGAIYRRERNPLQSTDFSFSRFLVPSLCDYEGWAIFMDCDMLMREDVAALWKLRDERYAVQVVKHHHVPREDIKFLGSAQTKYEKKNWSSVMLLNNARCRALTPDFVNAASGLQLHQFKWLDSDALIGELPSRWNHLVGYDAPRADASLVHFTIGGPYFHEYADCEYAGEWRAMRDEMLRAEQRAASEPSLARARVR